MKPAIDLTACKNVLIEKNKFELPTSSVVNALKMKRTDLRTDLEINFK